MGVTVWVPQEDGEIVVTHVDVVTAWPVAGHYVDAADDDEAARVVALVDGARLATGPEVGGKKRRGRRSTTEQASPAEPPADEVGGEDDDEPGDPAPTPQE